MTPVNSHLLITLTVLQKYWPKAGLGTLIALMMIPHSTVICLAWTAMFFAWVLIGAPLCPRPPLHDAPKAEERKETSPLVSR